VNEMSNTKELEEKYDLGTYPKRDLVLVRGKNAIVWDDSGNEYIDCATGVGVAAVGHCNDKVVEAINEQSSKLITIYGMFYNDVRAKCEEKLMQIVPNNLKRVFLCNSGAESVEAAIKIARASTGKKKIISLMKGFHGKTMGSLSATWDKKYKDMFAPLIPEIIQIPANNFDKLNDAVTDDTAAILLELVQGEGGVRLLDREYVSRVRELCSEKNVLLIIDEVQTGFGRTGKMFASQLYNVEPDIMCTAKAIAGGVPMGATFVCEGIELPKKSHTSTFGGNALACAACLATIDVIETENLCSAAEELGEYFRSQVNGLDLESVREVRGYGLMNAIELKEKAGPYVQKFQEKGIIILLAGATVLRFLPPLVITKEELDKVIKVISEVLA
jgi:LysW-gamma-L-lysine/LysW-L-ornithine aminotransferase